ncbi:hypothetical protein PAXRUDRAFT_800482, partial [Paxillus rubicundulus Ve08.2h10]
MSRLSRKALVGDLTKAELVAALPVNTFTRSLRNMRWSNILEIVQVQPDHVQDMLHHANEVKKRAKQEQHDHKAERMRFADARCHKLARQKEREEMAGGTERGSEPRNLARYLALPSEDEVKACHKAFLAATSNEALAMSICVICAWELMKYEGETHILLDIPNIRKHLTPNKSEAHPAHRLWEGMLLLDHYMEGEGSQASAW